MPLLLFAAFLIVPILEIALIIQVGQVIGGWSTVGLLIAISVFGAWLVRREGRRAWKGLNEALLGGRLPDMGGGSEGLGGRVGTELADGALVLVGGALLLTPGFITDAFGFFVVLPFTRPITRRALASYLERRMRLRAAQFHGEADGTGEWKKGTDEGSPRTGSVIRGEVVDD